MTPDDFTRRPPPSQAVALDGLAGVIDLVAAAAPMSHRFLRYQWFAAALGADGGAARTILVEHDGDPVIALPFTRVGPAAARLAMVPGCYWPFRSFPATALADEAAFVALLGALGREVNALRIGPVYDGDPALAALVAAARSHGWAALDRFVADSFMLDMRAAQADGGWPRNSTLRKNRFHEKHLAAHGVLGWGFMTGADLRSGGFDWLAEIERKSWITAHTDGGDAKFTASGHGGFWRMASADPVIADMMWAAMLTVDGAPAAFSFDLNLGPLKYAIANSYDPAFAKHSPGKLLYYRNLVQAMSNGFATVDWGAGDSGYKQVIGAKQGPAIRDWLFLRPGAPAMLGRMLRGGWMRSGNKPAARTEVEAEH